MVSPLFPADSTCVLQISLIDLDKIMTASRVGYDLSSLYLLTMDLQYMVLFKRFQYIGLIYDIFGIFSLIGHARPLHIYACFLI